MSKLAKPKPTPGPGRAEEAERLLKGITPGTWVAHEMLHYGESGTGFGSVDSHCPEGRADGFSSRDDPPWLHVTDDLFWGDAQFIAAAPRLIRDLLAERADLLAALKDNVSRHDAVAVKCNFDSCGCPDCAIARPVIDRAEGRAGR